MRVQRPRFEARVALLSIAVLLFVTVAALADRVRLSNGRVLEGRVRELPSGEVEIRSSIGTLRIPAEMVAAIEVAETREERVDRLLREHPDLTADEIFELAQESRGEGATTLANRLLRLVLEHDPDHEEARRLLGFRRFDGRWVTEEEWHQLRGELQFRGEWMTPADRARILELEAYRAQIAEQRRLESERRMWEERQRREVLLEQRRPVTQGIPYEWVWAPSSGGVVLPPAFVPLPAAPTAPAPTVRPPVGGPPPSSPPRGRANRGRFQRPPR